MCAYFIVYSFSSEEQKSQSALMCLVRLLHLSHLLALEVSYCSLIDVLILDVVLRVILTSSTLE